jgi:lysophospholipase L1-like esterase
MISNWAQDAHVPLFDLTPAFREDQRKLFFIEDLHFNPAGHRKAAELMAEFLVQKGLLANDLAPPLRSE